MKFESLGLAPKIQKAIEACGYQEMTPIQEQAIPAVRRGQDALINAQTGTGKTAAFALPILQQMVDKPRTMAAGKVRALILTPTRELAEQLSEAISEYARNMDITMTAIYGGVNLDGQVAKLRTGLDILIATPGRLLAHTQANHVDLSEVSVVVLDEADRLLDMGFIEDALRLINQTAKNRQTLLVSATITPALNELAHQILKNPADVRISKANITAETVEHVIYPVSEDRKLDLFMALLEEHNWYQILVFTGTKKQAERLLERLKKTDVPVALCHGDTRQGQRRRALAEFKSAKVQVLISTEVAARGLDIDNLDYVLNYNLPHLPEDYVHRVGRTGRAGKSGQAISFVCPQEARALQRIERLIGEAIPRVYKRGFELSEADTIRETNIHQPKPKKYKQSSQKQKPGNANKATKPKRKSRKSISSRAGGAKNRKARKKNK
ncbi:RNA helicase [Marinicella pacifica]|uniref:RNA helicase n=1 Tax=Marinicella pacifica TaxID=1171543 RepID=A0A917FRX3_9GAMM|nr:DEAD/DEAH box helicase [Marinicella pacifica]GGF97392.1 RNA helicase [Marinicella pacifica]